MPSDDDEPLAACHERISANSYREPRQDELDELGPCGFCFPDDEIHVDESQLLVSDVSRRARKLHRDADSDGELWMPNTSPSRELAEALSDPEVTDPADLPDGVLGGGA